MAAAVGLRARRAGRPRPRYAWDILINATPRRLARFPDETPVPAYRHRAGTVVFDMVYDPLETRLLREARPPAARSINGLEMLIAQAVAQFEAWTGADAPTMRDEVPPAIVAVQEPGGRR